MPFCWFKKKISCHIHNIHVRARERACACVCVCVCKYMLLRGKREQPNNAVTKKTKKYGEKWQREKNMKWYFEIADTKADKKQQHEEVDEEAQNFAT